MRFCLRFSLLALVVSLCLQISAILPLFTADTGAHAAIDTTATDRDGANADADTDTDTDTDTDNESPIHAVKAPSEAVHAFSLPGDLKFFTVTSFFLRLDAALFPVSPRMLLRPPQV